jgi:hypothetical protein
MADALNGDRRLDVVLIEFNRLYQQPHNQHVIMENEKTRPSRRKFVLGLGVVSLLSAIGLGIGRKKAIVSCDPDPTKKTIKMLTQDGKLVEIEEDKLMGQRKKITDDELKSFVKKS